jgi:predicted Zn-dependent protease
MTYEYGRRRAGGGITLIIGLIMAVVALFKYFGSEQINAVTGQKQHVSISPAQEVALGLQAAPEMAQQYGGESSNERGRAEVEHVGSALINTSTVKKSPYKYQFHLLADPQTINAFALPGGQVFITEGLFKRLRTEGELAGVLGHEVGHVVARHSAQQLAKQQLTQGLTGAAALASYDPNNPSSRGSAAVAALIGNLVNLKFSRNDELEADTWGVRLEAEAGYDPRAMLGVMTVLKQAAGSGHTPEFFQTHPNPDNRMQKIKQAIEKQFPNGVPDGLMK